VLLTAAAAGAPLRPDPAALARATPELRERLGQDPLVYFRFINRPWTARVCEVFAPVLPGLPIVQLHGDAHVEQYAFTNTAWGLDDFDDSARGPALVDIVRFLGSVELAARNRGWTGEVNRLFDRFFDGYRRGLADPKFRPGQPDVVRRLRARTPTSRAAHLAWGQAKMQPATDVDRSRVAAAMAEFSQVVHRARPDLPRDYFTLKQAGGLRMGTGSAVNNKVLIRVEGPSADPDDDVFLEAKQLSTLAGIACLQVPPGPEAMRVINGTAQMGRISHDILGMAPTMEGDPTSEWWIRSWEPSYAEIRLSDLSSVRDLTAIVYDSGVQLGAGCLEFRGLPAEASLRKKEQKAVGRLESRLRKGTMMLVGELLAGWQEFRKAAPAP
jgi:uncharacterized protein (DUF2252 family)